MGLEKYWANPVAKEDNFIVYDQGAINRLKAKKENISTLERELSHGILNEKFIGLPISYIRYVEYRPDDKLLRFYYNQDSEDEICISDPILRKEIFDFLKENTKIKRSTVQTPSIIKRIKKPLVALLVVIGIFLYVYSIIYGLNQGYVYELRGGRPGLAGVVLILAELGLIKNIMIFSPLALISIFSMVKKYKNASEIYSLFYR